MPQTSSLIQIRARAEARVLSRADRIALVEELAFAIVSACERHTAKQDRTRMRMLARLMRDPAGQVLTTALTDRLYRSKSAERVMDEIAHLLELFGLPRYMRPVERVELSGAGLLSRFVPSLMAGAVLDRVRSETRTVLLSADEKLLSAHLAERHAEQIRVNINQLGEALLGEREAEARVAKYEKIASRNDIDAVSVKVSSIGSQINLLAFEDTVQTLATRLERIYRATLRVPEEQRPLVMLDMEAYQDIELTFAVMERALRSTDLDRVRAGVVLQAYLPDSHAWLNHLIRFANERTLRGAKELRLRLVKGANLAQERVDSARMGVEVPIFARKELVDASYKRMLERVMTKEALTGLALGIASHNVFDIAYALVLGSERDVTARVGFEVLEGMADPLRRTLSGMGADVLVYAPICGDDEMNNGIAYLVRRLDENTSADNYLRSSFEMRAGDASFVQEMERFRKACALVDTLDTRPRRLSDAAHDRTRTLHKSAQGRSFVNEPDTDFAQPENRQWIERALAVQRSEEPRTIRSRIAGRFTNGGKVRDGEDPSRPGLVPYRLSLASSEQVREALTCAQEDRAQFSRTQPAERARLLTRVAQNLRNARAELIAAMVMDAGKRVPEADAEVSEAIDFAEYYRTSFLELERHEGLTLSPRGVVVVTPPWNFPLAIPAGGVLAALMAANRVILKPALETPYVAELLARILWDSGVPPEALQLVICEDEVGSALIQDPRVDSVILTGATSTARLFQRLRPGLRLLAETGGKNAYVVSAMSDRELAIRHVVMSAFGHAGQKCSACSLLILEAEVYDDPAFMATLKDAVESLEVGSAWDPKTFVTPLIREPEGPLAQALQTLDEGETWLVAPRVSTKNSRLVSPGVKLGVQPGSFTHTSELFGPVLGVMRARDLDHAIDLANATGYALTAGLASLDEREQAHFLARIRGGNVYINRTITGAVVERQPFGGYAKSGFGPGAKAGGPNYVTQLCHVGVAPGHEDRYEAALTARGAQAMTRPLSWLPAEQQELLRARVRNYRGAHQRELSRLIDRQMLLGQDNLLRYFPCPTVVLRVAQGAPLLDVASSIAAADLVGCRLDISIDPGFVGPKDAVLLGHPVHVESAAALLERVKEAVRVRVLGSRERELDTLNERTGAHIASEPVIACGRVELLHYLHEQSISIDYHRYGNLGARGLTRR